MTPSKALLIGTFMTHGIPILAYTAMTPGNPVLTGTVMTHGNFYSLVLP